MRLGSILVPLLAICAGAGGPARSQQQPNPRIGERLAKQWCSSCHYVARDPQGPAPDTAPTFASIAARPNMSAGVLRSLIQMPYPRMPQIALSRAEVEHIVAYILSLKH